MRRSGFPIAAALAVPVAAALAVAGTSRRLVRKLAEFSAAPPEGFLGASRFVASERATVHYHVRYGDPRLRPLVFVHGWGSSSFVAWANLAPLLRPTCVFVDLPGHGGSRLEGEFDFAVASAAVCAATRDSGVIGAVLVAHSMGGPVGLCAIRSAPGLYSGFVGVATSAVWSGVREAVLSAVGPHVRSSRSPWLLSDFVHRVEAFPEHASPLVWAWEHRPPNKVLVDSAAHLRRFDAMSWEQFALPEDVVWVVAEDDRVVPPKFQHRSAAWCGAKVVSLPDATHSFMVFEPGPLAETLNALAV